MINFIKNAFDRFLEKRNSTRLFNLVGELGEDYRFEKGSNIELSFGSTKNDISIGKRMRLRGKLASQYGGKITIGNYSNVNENTVIGAVNSVVIGDFASIAANVTIMDNNNHPVQPDDRKIKQFSESGDELRSWKYAVSKPIIIKNNVWIGANARINKGVTIGQNSIVAANAVVTKDVPDNSIAAGNPAKIVKTDIHLLPRFFDYKINE
ncbi:acyltransferase [Arenibacter sp. TNZ]|jgi:maltose O-acetyltransferase|uniref:acyltransferase n=1 Tax=Arenibacter TaxID=178469 RepID=UPI000CD4103E|nr:MULTISPECIES: acyltransferase [Arenibacter]MCM4174103.1 acyltransferase [Arenibacter sp. TNZ]